MSSAGLTYWRLLLDGRLSDDSVDHLLRRLAQPSAPRPVVFEARASGEGVRWLIGSTPVHLPELRSLTAHVLSARLMSVDETARPLLGRVGTMTIAHPGLPLDSARGGEVTHALFEALTRVRGSESLALQAVLGRGISPQLSRQRSRGHEPNLLERLALQPIPSYQGRALARHQERAERVGLALTVRLGALAEHPDRERALVHGLRDALHLLDAPGGRLVLTPNAPSRLQAALPNLVRRVCLSTPEAVPLLALPVSQTDLPGLPLHPRRPLAPVALETKRLVFATASAPGDPRPVGVTPTDLLQHCVITGPTGSGKSTLIAAIAEEWIRSRRPIALLDPKRQLVDHLLSRLPKSAAGRVVVLDPTDSPVVGFNPLDTTGRNPDVVVDGILTSLRAIFEDGWGPRTEDLLLAGLRSLALAGEKRGEPYTLIDLPLLYMDARLRRTVAGQVADDHVLASYWASHEAMSETARTAMIAAPLNKLRRFLLRPTLVRVLGQNRPRVRVRDLYKGSRALLVPLNDALLGPGSAQLLGSLLVSELFLAAQERALEDDPRSRPALLAIDEAQRFIHLPTALEDALATSRSYGVAWLVAHQYRTQLSAALRAGFDSNARSKLVFRSAYEDAHDYAMLARTLTPDDFMTLDKYELYATVMHNGDASSWFSARALPPRPELGFGEHIRAASRASFGAVVSSTYSAADASGRGSDDAPHHRKARSS